jgi:two-component system, chemotaxis family, sensor kinase CheA
VSDIQQQLLAAFDVEHKEHTEAMRAGLAQMRDGHATDMRKIFRHAHTLKGAARAVGLPELETLAHRLESIFLRLEGDVAGERREDFAVIDSVLDLIESYVAAKNRGAPVPDITEAHAALDRLSAAERMPGQSAPAPREHAGAPGEGAAGHASPGPATSPDLLAAGRPDQDASPLEFLRVPADQIDMLTRAAQELLRELHHQGAHMASLRTMQVDEREMQRQWRALRRMIDPAMVHSPTLSVALSAFEEQLRGRERALNRTVQSRAQMDWAIGEAFGRVRDRVEQVSLISAELVFGDMARMTRELARAQGHMVEVSVRGLDVQAERSVLQRLREPLIHALRNAVSHGSRETAEERRARSKPAVPQVGIDIVSDGGELTLSVHDDGPGPDLARIEAQARKSGLLDEAASRAEPSHLLEMLFEPGFSTATDVDEISGRGVGLSAVAEAVRQLRGRVVFLRRNPGAELRMVVPLSASRQAMVFVSTSDQTFGIPAHAVERLVRLRPDDFVAAENPSAIRTEMAGQSVVIPFTPLSRLLDMPPTEPPPADGLTTAVVLRQGMRRLAVQVEAILDVQPGILGSADALASPSPLVAGTAFPTAAAPAVVLDVEALFAQARRPSAPSAAARRRPSQEARRTPTILVVDDSITTRTLEKSILEAQGYRVLTSVDGIDALTAIRSSGELVDLVVADIEMPRLDGFGLLQAMKNDPKLATIPVVIVTSREDPSHIRRGLELGAAAYITKQKFDQRELLTTISQFV